MKINLTIILILFSIVSFAQIQTTTYKNKEGYFDSEMVKAVMNDSYMQYISNISINKFIYDEEKEKQTFAESFSNSNYQGVIELKDKVPYKYYIKKAIVYWEVYNPSGLRNEKTGHIDINKFYRDNGVSNDKKCPWCVVIVLIGAANCATNTAMCNTRCNNCRYGASVCRSSCWTNSCEVHCNPPPDQNSFLFNPWGYFGDTILSSGPFTIYP